MTRPLHLAAIALLASGCATQHIKSHEGLNLHLDLGVAGAQSSTTFEGSSQKVSGTGVGFSAAMGGAVAPNLVLGLEAWVTSVGNPKVSMDGASATLGDDWRYNVYGVGPRLTWYAMPYDVYLSVTPSLAQMSISTDGASADTDLGFGVRAALGKEWFVEYSSGLGLAGVVHYSRNGDGGSTWSTFGGGVVCSFTFN